DLMAPTMAVVREQLRGQPSDKVWRRITDHLRASVFILSEGVAPSNEGRGYIPRRLLRRCIALATRAGAPFDYAPVLESLVERFGDAYPRLVKNRAAILAAV